MNLKIRRTVAPLLILLMLCSGFGHLFTQSIQADGLAFSASEMVDDGHHHESQHLHQLTGTLHQHSSTMPDHLHDNLQLPVSSTTSALITATAPSISVVANLPVAPRFRIERPPRLIA